MRLTQFNEEVFYSDDKIVKVGPGEIELLKQKARSNKRRRVRLCAHRSTDDKLHEMLIVHTKDAYIRPHKHLNKTESFHLIEGVVDIVIFDDEGAINEVISICNSSPSCLFYYRMSDPYFHTLIIRSEFLVFHEVTNGPFDRKQTVFAPWAPDETDSAAQAAFLKQLSQSVDGFLSLHK